MQKNPQVEDEVVVMSKPDQHILTEVVYFYEATVGYKDGLPIRKTLERPYFRFYCSCGTVGGKRDTQQQAESAFKAHKESEESP